MLANNTANTTDGSVTGDGTLNITSGAILRQSAMPPPPRTTSPSAVPRAWSPPANTQVLKLSGNLTGTNGLTKCGATSLGTVVLSGDNSGLTGTLTMNAGTLQFNSAQAFPGGSDAIVVNGGPSRQRQQRICLGTLLRQPVGVDHQPSDRRQQRLSDVQGE